MPSDSPPIAGAVIVDGNAVDQDMGDLRDLGHQRHDRAGERAYDQGERDQVEFVAAQQRADADQDAVRSFAIDDMPDPREHSGLLFYASDMP
jgi:hypothetical protein